MNSGTHMMAGKQNSLEEALKIDDLDTTLRKDKKRCDEADLQVMWYHGKINRQTAENILHEERKLRPNENCNGMFLVRDSTASEVDFTLSYLFETRCYHFFIEEKKNVLYGIEGGPVVHGLDQLIEHYIEVSNRWQPRLTKLCKGRLPPVRVRKYGPTNCLHKAVKEKRDDIVDQILAHPLCPDVNAKNKDGSTALHDATSLGLEKAVNSLLSHGADYKIKDSKGATPVHKACEVNGTNALYRLITHDKACLQLRNPLTGEVPLHSAVCHGHTQCAEILLNAGAVLFPRTLDGITPIEMAETNRRKDCIALLENFKEPAVYTRKSEWYHPELDYQGAERVFSSLKPFSGLFLIRPNKNIQGHVLSLYKGMAVHHYGIRTKDYRNHCVHYIGDGPYHKSLELLVQYHHCFEDGLGTPLKASISTSYKIIELHVSETYASPSPKSPVANPMAPPKDHSKPKLTPRPPALDSPPPSPTKETPGESHVYSTISSDEEETEKASPDYITVVEEPQMVQEIRKEDLKIGVELRKCPFGSLMKGTLTMKERPFKRDVAIQILDSVWNLSHFKREISVRHALKNDYIVELLGVCYGCPIMLVEEMLPMGSVLEYLRDFPEHVSVEQELYLWSVQIARGMLYLEEKRLVHRDLAARNILLHSLQLVKISEFGLSRAIDLDKDYYKASPGSWWPIKWYAPESVLYNQFSNASDVWSFGVTLWEMFSYGMVPFDKMSGFEVTTFIQNGKRLEKPEKCPYAVYLVMNQCWSYKPEDRPTFTGLQKYFDGTPEYMSLVEALRIKRDGK